MKKMKYVIILLLLIILIAIVSVILVNNNSKKTVAQNVTQTVDNETEDEYINATEAADVFSVTSYINKYFDIINKNNASYYGVDSAGNRIKTIQEEQIQQNIYDILAEDYIEKNNIQKENIYTYIPNLEEKVIFVPLEMKVKTKQDIQRYIVKGFIENINYQYISDIYIIVNVDKQTGAFSIEPTNNKQQELEELEDEIQIKEIEKNENNEAKKETTNDQYIANQYVNLYKRIALAKPEQAYELLDDEYKIKRFENVENYKAYIENTKDELKKFTLNKYLKTQENQYVCQDKNEIQYVFKVGEGVLDYKIRLDTYTIRTDENKEKYANSSNEQKVALNTQLFVEMINNKDYHTIYKLLDDEYKTKYFPTEEELVKYFKYYAPNYYTYESKSIDKKEDIYIQEINLYEKQKQNTIGFGFTLMMQLKEEEEFKISFGYTLDV